MLFSVHTLMILASPGSIPGREWRFCAGCFTRSFPFSFGTVRKSGIGLAILFNSLSKCLAKIWNLFFFSPWGWCWVSVENRLPSAVNDSTLLTLVSAGHLRAAGQAGCAALYLALLLSAATSQVENQRAGKVWCFLTVATIFVSWIGKAFWHLSWNQNGESKA